MDLVLQVCTGRQRVTMACRGKLVAGEEADAFRRSALLLMGGFDRITIDLAGLRSADGGGVSTLASVLAQAVAKGKRARIRHAGPWLLPLLHSNGLADYLRPLAASVPPVGEAYA